jgi:hypothetical protein
MMKFTLLFLGLISTSALGQAYECRTPSGNIVLQYGVPCAPGTDTRNPSRDAQNRQEQERAQRKVHEEREMEAAVLRREIRIGMTAEQVVRVWGNPARHTVHDDGGKTRESWYWRCADRRLGSNLIVFRNGAVSSITRAC